jgi:hypothetical protein
MKEGSVSDLDLEGGQPGLDRRALVKKLAVGAFAVPAIVSFQLDSLARAQTFKGESHRNHPKQECPNQTNPNQTWPNQKCDDKHRHKRRRKHKKNPPPVA